MKNTSLGKHLGYVILMYGGGGSGYAILMYDGAILKYKVGGGGGGAGYAILKYKVGGGLDMPF